MKLIYVVSKCLVQLSVVILLISSCKKERIEKDKESELVSSENIYQQLIEIDQEEDSKLRLKKANSLWTMITKKLSVPYVKDDSAIFLYYGQSNSVEWNGDFNSWGGQSNFDNNGKNIDSTKLWYLLKTFPKDSRLDYKITLNGSNWILDPNNSRKQWSGFGPNSVLAMPNWEEEAISIARSSVAKGKKEQKQLFSNKLNYAVNYTVYTPSGYNPENVLPVIYVTDGHEYMDEKLGNMPNTLDNMIADQLIDPVIAVFIDPRNVNNTDQNRRQSEYTLNENYLNFVQAELMVQIAENYKVEDEKIAILGTSLGGLNSSYFGSNLSSSFNFVACQSPAYWYRTEIFSKVSSDTSQPDKVFITAGTFNDGLENARKMEKIYFDQGVEPEFLQVNEGHSWGAWRQQINDILLFFYKKN